MLGKDLEVNTVIELKNKLSENFPNKFIYLYYRLAKGSDIKYGFSYLLREPDPFSITPSGKCACVSHIDLRDYSDLDVVNIYKPTDFYFYKNDDENMYSIDSYDVYKSSFIDNSNVDALRIKNINNGEITKWSRNDNCWLYLGPASKNKLSVPNGLINDIYDSLGE